MSDVTDRRFAVIAGASSGIGFEPAKVFAENGFDLAAVDEELNRAAGELGEIAPSVETVKVHLAGLGERVTGGAQPPRSEGRS